METAFNRAALAVTSLSLALAVMLTACRSGTPSDTDTESGTTADTTSAQTFSISFTFPSGAETSHRVSDGAGIDLEYDLDDATLRKTRLVQTVDLGADYTDRFLFVCDHVAYGLRSLGMLDAGRGTDQVVTGAGGSFFVSSPSTTVYLPDEDKSVTLAELVADKKPEYILLAVGAADIESETKPSAVDFRDEYIALIESVKSASPDSDVICMSILPGSRSSELSIYDVEQYNKMILSAAASSDVYYLDAASAFSSSSGYLREEYDGGSSRLSATGLLKLLEVVRTHRPSVDSGATDTDTDTQ